MIERKVKWSPKTGSLYQIPTEGLEYAWVSKDYEQVHRLVWCKDFLHDIVYACINNVKINIYKLEYDPLLNPRVFCDTTRLMITCFKDDEFGRKVQNNLLPFLHAIEKKMGLNLTVIEKCHPVPPVYARSGVYLLNSDQRWMIAPPLVSMYALFIRVGLLHSADKTFGTTLRCVRDNKIAPYFSDLLEITDKHLLKESYKTIQMIVKNGIENVFGSKIENNYPVFDRFGFQIPITAYHDRFGLSGFSKKFTFSYFPMWHRKSCKGVR